MIFDDEYFSKIVKNSNEYKAFKIKKKGLDTSKINKGFPNLKKSVLNEKSRRIERMANVDIQKIEKYIALEILKGIVKLPSFKDYWSKDELLINSISSIMTESMYCSINECIHPEKGDAVGHEKIINSIIYIMNNSRKYYYPSTYLTIDECMISYRGKSSDIVFESSKPTKWGFRPYVLSDASTGYTFCFKLLEELEDNKFGKMYGLVTEFLDIIWKNNTSKIKHVLATDGLYTSENLLEIKDFYFVGAIRANRIKNGESALNDSIGKSSYEFYYKILNGNKFILTKFNDTK